MIGQEVQLYYLKINEAIVCSNVISNYPKARLNYKL